MSSATRKTKKVPSHPNALNKWSGLPHLSRTTPQIAAFSRTPQRTKIRESPGGPYLLRDVVRGCDSFSGCALHKFFAFSLRNDESPNRDFLISEILVTSKSFGKCRDFLCVLRKIPGPGNAPNRTPPDHPRVLYHPCGVVLGVRIYNSRIDRQRCVELRTR